MLNNTPSTLAKFGFDEETSNEVKLKQAVKAPLPIVFTVEGILIFSNNLTILKQYSPISSKPSFKVILSK